MLIVLLGKTCVGKDTVAAELQHRGWQRIITCTTRPPRPGEADGKTYYFLEEEEFQKRREAGRFLEWRRYEMAGTGPVYYGSLVDDYRRIRPEQKKVVVLTPEGLAKLRELGIPATAFYLEAGTDTLRRRLAERGDDPAEAARRLASDHRMFAGIGELADHTIPNDGRPVEKTAEQIVQLCLDGSRPRGEEKGKDE